MLDHVSVGDFKNGRLFNLVIGASFPYKLKMKNFRVTAADVLTRTFAKPEFQKKRPESVDWLIKLFHGLLVPLMDINIFLHITV